MDEKFVPTMESPATPTPMPKDAPITPPATDLRQGNASTTPDNAISRLGLKQVGDEFGSIVAETRFKNISASFVDIPGRAQVLSQDFQSPSMDVIVTNAAVFILVDFPGIVVQGLRVSVDKSAVTVQSTVSGTGCDARYTIYI